MKADTVTKDFISDVNIFADIFNYYIYNGRQVIAPQDLTGCDPVEIALPYGADGEMVPVQKFRDVQKLYAAMTDGDVEYVLYGVENQTNVHYAMAVRNNLYDALEYAGQVEEKARNHRREMKQEKRRERDEALTERKTELTAGEFLGGFWKEDRLIPSVTLTVYFGCDRWDGPMSLFDMMEVKDSKMLSVMDNYHLRLIAPAAMPDEEIMKFRTNFREVMLFIKYSKDKEKLREILKANERRFREVERRAADVIEVITNSGLKYDEGDEKVDMCQAILEMRLEAEQIGEKKGEQKGKQIGERIGELRKAQAIAKKLYEMGIDVEKIAEGVEYPLETVKAWMGLKE